MPYGLYSNLHNMNSCGYLSDKCILVYYVLFICIIIVLSLKQCYSFAINCDHFFKLNYIAFVILKKYLVNSYE